MFNSGNCYSLADIAAATGNGNNGGNGNGWGDGNWSWIIVLFLFCFMGGWGRNGWGNGNDGGSASGQGSLTRADLCSEFSFNDLQGSVRGVNQGLCDGFYAMNTGMLNGFAGVNNAVCTLGYQNQQGINDLSSQIARCCCDSQSSIRDAQFATMQGQNAIQNQISSCCCNLNNNITSGFADIKYAMATDTCALQTTMANNTRDIIDSQNAGTRAILDYLCQEKIADLQSENQNLRLAASQQAQNNYLIQQLKPCPQPCYAYSPPHPIENFGVTCGCNTGCGC